MIICEKSKNMKILYLINIEKRKLLIKYFFKKDVKLEK
jgi:hypothetical protein